jgi:peptidoglycan/LPS O-acetylase OafA/YrhL
MTRKKFFSLELLDNRFPALHGLRVLAILSVVQFHVTWIFAGENGIKVEQEFAGWSLSVFFGMDLFFILSGFLIGSILLHSLRTNGSQNLRRFYIRRASRTFPPYYLVLTALAIATPLTAMQLAHLKWEYVYGTNFVSLQRKDILMFWGWSLALEEQFYLTVPLLFFLLWKLPSDRARVTLLVSLWSLALVIRLVLFYAKQPWTDLALYEALYFRPHTRFDTLVAGVLLAFVYNRWKEPIRAFLQDPFHRALVALPSLGCMWLLLRPNLFGDNRVQIVHVFGWGTLTSVMYFGPLLMLLLGDGPFVKALSHPVFRRIATLGYGVYLMHIPVCDHVIVPMAKALDARHVPMAVIWPLSLALVMLFSIAIGYVLHVFVEKPSLALRDRLAA